MEKTQYLKLRDAHLSFYDEDSSIKSIEGVEVKFLSEDDFKLQSVIDGLKPNGVLVAATKEEFDAFQLTIKYVKLRDGALQFSAYDTSLKSIKGVEVVFLSENDSKKQSIINGLQPGGDLVSATKDEFDAFQGILREETRPGSIEHDID